MGKFSEKKKVERNQREKLSLFSFSKLIASFFIFILFLSIVPVARSTVDESLSGVNTDVCDWSLKWGEKPAEKSSDCHGVFSNYCVCELWEESPGFFGFFKSKKCVSMYKKVRTPCIVNGEQGFCDEAGGCNTAEPKEQTGYGKETETSETEGTEEPEEEPHEEESVEETEEETSEKPVVYPECKEKCVEECVYVNCNNVGSEKQGNNLIMTYPSLSERVPLSHTVVTPVNSRKSVFSGEPEEVVSPMSEKKLKEMEKELLDFSINSITDYLKNNEGKSSEECNIKLQLASLLMQRANLNYDDFETEIVRFVDRVAVLSDDNVEYYPKTYEFKVEIRNGRRVITEWSEDGEQWNPLFLSNEDNLIKSLYINKGDPKFLEGKLELPDRELIWQDKKKDWSIGNFNDIKNPFYDRFLNDYYDADVLIQEVFENTGCENKGEIINSRGGLELSLGNLVSARSDYNHVINLDYSNENKVRAYIGLAASYLQEENIPVALDNLRNALEIAENIEDSEKKENHKTLINSQIASIQNNTLDTLKNCYSNIKKEGDKVIRGITMSTYTSLKRGTSLGASISEVTEEYKEKTGEAIELTQGFEVLKELLDNDVKLEEFIKLSDEEKKKIIGEITDINLHYDDLTSNDKKKVEEILKRDGRKLIGELDADSCNKLRNFLEESGDLSQLFEDKEIEQAVLTGENFPVIYGNKDKRIRYKVDVAVKALGNPIVLKLLVDFDEEKGFDEEEARVILREVYDNWKWGTGMDKAFVYSDAYRKVVDEFDKNPDELVFDCSYVSITDTWSDWIATEFFNLVILEEILIAEATVGLAGMGLKATATGRGIIRATESLKASVVGDIAIKQFILKHPTQAKIYESLFRGGTSFAVAGVSEHYLPHSGIPVFVAASRILSLRNQIGSIIAGSLKEAGVELVAMEMNDGTLSQGMSAGSEEGLANLRVFLKGKGFKLTPEGFIGKNGKEVLTYVRQLPLRQQVTGALVSYTPNQLQNLQGQLVSGIKRGLESIERQALLEVRAAQVCLLGYSGARNVPELLWEGEYGTQTVHFYDRINPDVLNEITLIEGNRWTGLVDFGGIPVDLGGRPAVPVYRFKWVAERMKNGEWKYVFSTNSVNAHHTEHLGPGLAVKLHPEKFGKWEGNLEQALRDPKFFEHVRTNQIGGEGYLVFEDGVWKLGENSVNSISGYNALRRGLEPFTDLEKVLEGVEQRISLEEPVIYQGRWQQVSENELFNPETGMSAIRQPDGSVRFCSEVCLEEYEKKLFECLTKELRVSPENAEEMVRGAVEGGYFPDEPFNPGEPVRSDLEKIALGSDEHGGNELREQYLSRLRTMHGIEGPKYEGFVLEDILDENREAFRELRNQIMQDSPDVIITMERGGTFIGEILTDGGNLEDKLVNLPKVLDPAGKLRFDAEYFKSRIQEQIDNGAQRIAIADSYMGGRFSRELRDNVLKPIMNNNPNVEFDIYFMREMYGFEGITDEGIIPTPFQGGFKPTSPFFERTRHHVVETRIVLGDDMEIILDKISSNPITIFTDQGFIKEIYIPETTSRDQLMELLLEELYPSP